MKLSLGLVVSGLAILVFALPMSAVHATPPKVVYGEDNRVEVSEFPDARFREFALSVAGKVRSMKLYTDRNNPDVFDFPKITAGQDMNLCNDQRFINQYTLPVCSGFLVAPDVLVTAGHCVESDFDCQTSSWVFDFLPGIQSIAKKNVYRCKEVIKQELTSSWYKLRDYAVIRLERKVEDFRRPLKFRNEKTAHVGASLVVIGHPSAMPLKIADNAKIKPFNWVELLTPVRTIVRKKYYFTANLDTFAGNSGSPVFNQKTGKIEGILVQGATDYRRNPDNLNCIIPTQRSNSTFTSSEKVYRITQVPGLKEIVKSSSTPE